jgi:uncharacterized DUF497 family protein
MLQTPMGSAKPESNEEALRIISARKATRQEIKKYEEGI